MTPLKAIQHKTNSIDWITLGSAVLLSFFGLFTMSSYSGHDPYFIKQLVWIAVSVAVFFGASFVDWRFLRRSGVAAGLYAVVTVPLVLLLVLGRAVKGAKSWIALGGLGIEPIEFVKLALIIILAKYFSRRHIEIRNIRHIFVSGMYAFIVFALIALQPDFGGAIIIFLIWLGMVLFSGISRKHLLTVATIGGVAFAGLWLFGFHDYQKNRIINFVNPTHDIHGTGYNVPVDHCCGLWPMVWKRHRLWHAKQTALFARVSDRLYFCRVCRRVGVCRRSNCIYIIWHHFYAPCGLGAARRLQL
jgi:rod shape determining protein RodA